jgi:hypothetical protein
MLKSFAIQSPYFFLLSSLNSRLSVNVVAANRSAILQRPQLAVGADDDLLPFTQPAGDLNLNLTDDTSLDRCEDGFVIADNENALTSKCCLSRPVTSRL